MYVTGVIWGMPGPTEMIIVGMVGLLLFGSRLPKLARSLGGSLVEFKRGLKEGASVVDEFEGQLKDAERELRK